MAEPKVKLLLIFLACVVVPLLAAAVWPTMYRYDHVRAGSGDFPVRTNRFTGDTYILYPSGWTHRGTPESPTTR